MQSMPRLKNEFKNAFIDMTNQIGKSVGNYSYNVTSMTRSKALNSSPDVNGDPNSGHLYGEGIDISLNSADGKKMLAWMNANSDGTPLTEADLSDPAKLKGYRRINGLPITWEAHDRGSGMHLDIKWAGGTK
jgi:hypothetical protein